MDRDPLRRRRHLHRPPVTSSDQPAQLTSSAAPPLVQPFTARSGPAIALCLAGVVIGLDGTVVNLALPTIARDLHTATDGIEWVVNAFTVPWASLLLLAGAVGDRIGPARLLRWCLLGFAAATAMSALSPNLGWLVAARVLQGLAAAGITPMVFALVGRAVPDQIERLKILNLLTFTGGAATAVGPFLGGALTDGLGWRWVFWLTLPLALMGAFLVGPAYAPGERRSLRASGLHVDLAGQAAGTAGLLLVVAGLIEGGGGRGWGSPLVLAMLVAGVLVIVAFVEVERRASEPIMPLSVFHHRSFRQACAGGFAFQFSAYGLQFMLALFVQRTWGVSPFEGGVLLVPYAAGVLVAGGVFNPWLKGHTARRRIVTGAAFAAGGCLVLFGLWHKDTWPLLLAGNLAVGIGGGIYATALNEIGASALGPSMAGIASGVYGTARQVGSAVGVAIIGALVTAPHSRGGLASGVALVLAASLLIGLVGAAQRPQPAGPAVGT